MFKLLIVILFLAVVGVLFSGLFFLMKDSSDKSVSPHLARLPL